MPATVVFGAMLDRSATAPGLGVVGVDGCCSASVVRIASASADCESGDDGAKLAAERPRTPACVTARISAPAQLRSAAEAAYVQRSAAAAMMDAMDATVDADLEAWDAWEPAEAARLFAGVEAPWYVAAGWAIDLFLGGKRREHEDLEVAVPRSRFAEFAERLSAYDLFVPVGNERLGPFDPDSESHQTWVRERGGGKWRLDVFREPGDGGTWVCRRDESIRLPYGEVIRRTDDGIPYLRPDLALLFKAKHADRDKDKADFADALPRLSAVERANLRVWLGAVHRGHAWLARL